MNTDMTGVRVLLGACGEVYSIRFAEMTRGQYAAILEALGLQLLFPSIDPSMAFTDMVSPPPASPANPSPEPGDGK